MEDPSGLGEWRPDPTGRHQLRWWDGSSWSDNVADQGESSTDPMGDEGPYVSTARVSSGAGGAGWSLPRAPVLAGAIAAVVAIAVALVLVRGGDDAKGFGEFEATLDSPTDVEVRTIKVPAKSLVRITATADAGFLPSVFAIAGSDYVAHFDEAADLSDVVDATDLAVVAQNAGSSFSEPSDLFDPAEKLAQLLKGVDLSGVLRPGDVLYNSSAQKLVFPAPVAGEFRILVAGGEGSTGGLRIKIDKVDVGGATMAEFFRNFDAAYSDAASDGEKFSSVGSSIEN